jgi:hypothetical protein
LGGLLKHHFAAVREEGGSTAASEMQNALRKFNPMALFLHKMKVKML